MTSTHTAHLHLQNLPPEATQTHLFPSLGDTHLLSIGKLCDAGCTAIFTDTDATIKRNGDIILEGSRSETSPRLWQINLPESETTYSVTIATEEEDSYMWYGPPKATEFSGLAVNQSAKPADLVAFSHATLFSPPLTTLAEALRKDFLIGFPGLTKETLAKYPPRSMATIKGHLDQSRTRQKRHKQPK